MSAASERTQPEGDAPVEGCEGDGLDFVSRYAVPLARRLSAARTSQAMTVGIYGSWGSGKTSLMNMVRRLVSGEDRVEGFVPEKGCLTVNFTAWKYDEAASLWRALVRTVLEQILRADRVGELGEAQQREVEVMRRRLYGRVQEKKRKLKIDWVRLAGGLASLLSVGYAVFASNVSTPIAIPMQALLASTTVAGVSLAFLGKTLLGIKDAGVEASLDKALRSAGEEIIGAFNVVEEVLFTHERIEFVEQFAEQFQRIVERYVPDQKLVVFIDDLDRCMPEKAVRVLEGIKLFLGFENTAFVLGVDLKVLARGIQIHYASQGYREDETVAGETPFSGIRYLEKVVQLPFHIPSISPREMARSKLVHGLRRGETGSWLEIGIRGFKANPRAVKRFAQIYRHRAEVIRATRPEVLEGRELHMAKLIVLQEHHSWHGLVDVIVEYTDPRRGAMLEGPLQLLERVANDPAERDALLGEGEASGPLSRFAHDRELLRFLGSPPLFGGDDPVNPIPLVHLGGGKPAEPGSAAEALSLDEVADDLASTDALARSRAQAHLLELDYKHRHEVFERAFERLYRWMEAPSPDRTGIPHLVDSLQKLLELGIAPELQDVLGEREELLSQAVERLGRKRGAAGLASKALLDLLTAIGSDREPAEASSDRVPGYLRDQPVSQEDDLLGFHSYAAALARVIDDAATPFHVAVFGRWGSGKSSFLRILEQQLMQTEGTRSVSLNAFASGGAKPLTWLIEGLVEALPGMRETANRLLATGDGAATDSPMPPGSIREGLEKNLAPVRASGGRLVVFIDDIDRCAPDQVVGTLEALQLVLHIAGVVVVVAADRAWLEAAVTADYPELLGAPKQGPSAADFLDKIFDLGFELPQQSTEATAEMTRALLTDEHAASVSDLSRFLEPNPRVVKRFVNRLRLYQALAEERGLRELSPRLLAELLLVEARWPDLLDKPALLSELWQALSQGDAERSGRMLEQLDREGRVLDLTDLAALMERSPAPDSESIARGCAFIHETARRSSGIEELAPDAAG